ncbi:hypothetical protein [Motilimonas pumila]|uniref:DUF4440 domain-containing protein n=1 Tax=Motilimonas pumila TaxID=2303987 RepID=A0A418YHS7_9GAMM|nr:hypothetical protein [Motilimonas pumila]RJG49879.1 hypothetical protein D1Z90_04330 [Motilimonas pumila]
MLRILILLTLAIAAPLKASSVPDEVKSQVTERANELSKATMSADYQRVIAMTHPKMIAKIGGPSMAKDIAYEAVRLLNERGVEIAGLKINEPTHYYHLSNTEVVVVPTELALTSGTGRVETNSYLLAVREQDKGWLFIDSNAIKNLDDLKTVLPQLPEEFTLPRKEVRFIPVAKNNLK